MGNLRIEEDLVNEKVWDKPSKFKLKEVHTDFTAKMLAWLDLFGDNIHEEGYASWAKTHHYCPQCGGYEEGLCVCWSR